MHTVNVTDISDAEIRSNVYDFVIKDRISLMRIANDLLFTRTDSFDHIRTLRPFSLAHVCRQIREEFLPILMRRTKVRVPHYDLAHHLRVFVQPANAKAAMLNGNVVLRLPPEGQTLNLIYNPHSIDVAPSHNLPRRIRASI